MRILYCNKFDYQFSGTEAYLFDLINRLDNCGHETALFTMDHGHTPAFTGRSYRIPYLNFKDPDAGFLKKVKMAGHALYSPSARRRMRDCLGDFSPDVAHIRGIYHHLSPSILWELKRRECPFSITSTILRFFVRPIILWPTAERANCAVMEPSITC